MHTVNRFDVFVSYSHKDRPWVEHWLIPRLKSQGVRYCVDYEQFPIGAMSRTNMEAAVRDSQRVLVVMTPAWVDSEWGLFEATLAHSSDPIAARRHVIPLMLEPCDCPAFLRLLTYLDFADERVRDSRFPRLIEALGLPPAALELDRVPTTDNPFHHRGRTQSPSAFYGRDLVLRHIFDELKKGSTISLTGVSAMGKSSILSMICHLGPKRLHGEIDLFGYLSLEIVRDERDFFAALSDLLGFAEPLRGFQLARAIRSRRIVLCLDEMEKMRGKGFSPDVRSELRGLAQSAGNPLRLVMASRVDLSELFPDRPGDLSPLAGICHRVVVPPFTPEECRGFVHSRLAGTGIEFTNEELDALIVESGGHPATLIEGASRLFSRHTTGGS